jgi:SAM-dependent methyltransferase
MTTAEPFCQICQSAQHQEAYAQIAGHDLRRCAECGFVYLHPLPSAETRDALYRDPYQGATTGYFQKIDKKTRRSRGRARQLAAWAKPGGRFLDVGCSGGFMVEAMRDRGFEAHGLDLDAEGISWARQHFPLSHFHNEPVESFARSGLRFDAIYSSEVIEHVADVNSFIAAIAHLLAPNGILYLTTPDITHWRRPRDLSRWDAFSPPSHCLYFNPRNLPRLLKRHGLSLRRRRLSFKPGIKMIFVKDAPATGSARHG